jgi:hypothetical protein
MKSPLDVPFYSPVDQAISKLSQAKGTGDQYLSMIRNTHGVKPQEIEDRGLKEKMTGKMSIPDVQRIASENPMQKITESTAHQSDFYYAGKGADGKYYLHTDSGKPIAGPYDMAHDAESNIEKFQANKPQYAKYQLPGGKNYREIKLRIPTKGKDKFKSKHFEEPNVLAHARVSDRTGPNGEKILHVEEIQSDWHQTARDLRNEEIDRLVKDGMPIEEAKKSVPDNFGYRGNLKELPSGYQVQEFNYPSGSKEYRVFSPKGNLYASGLSLESATKNAIENLNGGNKVPDAPHKKDWHELVLKHLLNHAAKNGYDKMIITRGEEQAKRYGLNKHIGEISYQHNPDNTVSIIGKDKNDGSTTLHEEDLPRHRLSKHVGAEMAQRIMAGEGTPYVRKQLGDPTLGRHAGKMVLGNLDLKVGDEGMKGFYNDIVPSFLNKYGKKWGAKVGQYNLSVHPHQADNQYAVHSFDITPPMREEIVNKGQSRYAKGGSVKPIPAEAGSTPLKEGHVRLYHQTDENNLRKIEREGLLLKHAKGIEGPRAIYAGETPFYGKAAERPTLEFQVPKEHWQSPFVLRDVAPKDIIAAHYPWHRHARYLESEDNKEAKENVLSGKHDNLGGDTGKAVQYIKAKYGVKKSNGGAVKTPSLDAMRYALMQKNKLSNGGRQDLSKYKDPKSTKISDWKWRKLPAVAADINMQKVPDYIQKNYGDFMKQQLAKANAGDMTARDFIKAYGITQSSIGRQGLSYDTATKTGMKLPRQQSVRPEGAFSEWLGSKHGQNFLNAAENGNVNEDSLKDMKEKFSPFSMTNALAERLKWAVEHSKSDPNLANLFSTMPLNDYRDMMMNIKGIGPAKSGFIGSLLGRGDLPTLDARQVLLHTGKYNKDPEFARRTSAVVKGKPVAGTEAVDRLIARQSAMGMDIDPTLEFFRQHLTHHAVWDKVGNTETTHGDVVNAMKNYNGGGDVKEPKEEYRGSHEAPGPENGAPMHDTKNIYPEDFYSHNGFRYYSDLGNDYDREAHNKVVSVKNKPDQMVWVHRAVPMAVYKTALKFETPLNHLIKRGDWVTQSKQYAKDHGEAWLKNDYKVVGKRVPAKHLYTEGNSIHEWGYYPDQNKARGGSIKEPKSTVPAYKLFRVDKNHPGKLFPLFVDAKTPVEKDKWVKAKAGEMAGEKVKSKIGPLAYRPGWHAGDLPIATHIGEKSDSKLNKPDRRPHNQVWAEIDMANDVDWQKKANERGMNKSGKLIAKNAHITDQVPRGGHYRYKTNPNMTGSWLIGGEMKVKRVLPDAEVQKINKKAKVKDLPREKPMNLKDWGFKRGGLMSLLQKSKD